MVRFIKILLVILVLLIAAALAVPFLVPADKIKDEVLAQITARTGRTVSIDHASFSVFPTLGLNAEGVKLGNPVWAGGGNMAEIKTLKVGLELLPLLHREVQLKTLTLEEPVITLIKRAGTANWEFSSANAAPAPTSAPKAKGGSPQAGPGLADLHLDNIAISDGTVTYKDETTGKTEIASGINLTLKAPDLSQKADITFSAVYGGKKADVTLALGKPLAYSGGGTTAVSLKAEYGPLNFTWKGELSQAAGNVPSVTGTLDIPSLNTIDLASKQSAGGQTPAGSAPAAHPPANASRWSDAPINLGGLKSANAGLTVTIGKLALPKTTLENITAAVRLTGGFLEVQVRPFKAYGGTISLVVAANASGSVGITFSAAGAEAEPLLHDFAGYDRLSGTINTQLKVTASGNSQRALVGTLAGNGNVNFKDGKLKGVNIASLLRNVTGAQGSDDQATDFSELSGTYTIARGIVTTNDLKLASPLLRMTGEGNADLPNWQEHFVLKPMLVASTQGQGGKDASGITVPVDVDGPLDHPHYKPDLQAALQENLKDPTQLKNNLKDIRKNLLNGGGLQNLLR